MFQICFCYFDDDGDDGRLRQQQRLIEKKSQFFEIVNLVMLASVMMHADAKRGIR
jgi:hypothetical protein